MASDVDSMLLVGVGALLLYQIGWVGEIGPAIIGGVMMLSGVVYAIKGVIYGVDNDASV